MWPGARISSDTGKSCSHAELAMQIHDFEPHREQVGPTVALWMSGEPPCACRSALRLFFKRRSWLAPSPFWCILPSPAIALGLVCHPFGFQPPQIARRTLMASIGSEARGPGCAYWRQPCGFQLASLPNRQDRPRKFNVSLTRCTASCSVVTLLVSRPVFTDFFAHSTGISNCR